LIDFGTRPTTCGSRWDSVTRLLDRLPAPEARYANKLGFSHQTP